MPPIEPDPHWIRRKIGWDRMTDWTAAGAFTTDPGMDFDARCTLGMASTGIGDVGIVLATLGRIGEPTPQERQQGDDARHIQRVL